MTTRTLAVPRATDPGTAWTTTLAAASLLWLLAMLLSVRHSLGDVSGTEPVTMARAALALPSVISASLVAGLATGLATVDLLARRWESARGRRSRRAAASTAAGLVLGVAVAVPVAIGYGDLPSILVVSGAIAGAAALGGLIAAVPYRAVAAAAVTGSLGVFVVGFAVGLFDGDLLALFGAGDTEASALAANAWVAFTTSLAAGLAAGALGYAYLRRYGPPEQRWPAYLLAGAGPGLLALAAEGVTRLGGARLFELVGTVSGDDIYLRYLNAARVNRTLIVLFAGALIAVFLLGRSLAPGAEEDGAEEEGAEPDAAPADRATADRATADPPQPDAS